MNDPTLFIPSIDEGDRGVGQEIRIPEAWQKVANEIAQEPGIVVLLGASDTGKTTLGRFLIGAWRRKGIPVALVDGDIGQSTIGPPACVGLAFFPPSAEITNFERSNFTFEVFKSPPPLALRFVGATSPPGHFLPLLVGLKKLVDRAVRLHAEIILVDTTGLVHGQAGRILKFQKIDLLHPRYLLALQRTDELEVLLAPHEKRTGLKIYRLPTAGEATNKSREARRAHRERKFQEYFQGSRLLSLSLKGVELQGTWIKTGRRLKANELNFLANALGAVVLYGERGLEGLNLLLSGGITTFELSTLKAAFGVPQVRITPLEDLQGLLLGFNDGNNDTLALGILQQLDPSRETLSCLTPLSDPQAVKLIQFGSLRIDPLGRELGTLPCQESL